MLCVHYCQTFYHTRFSWNSRVSMHMPHNDIEQAVPHYQEIWSLRVLQYQNEFLRFYDSIGTAICLPLVVLHIYYNQNATIACILLLGAIIVKKHGSINALWELKFSRPKFKAQSWLFFPFIWLHNIISLNRLYTELSVLQTFITCA